MRVALTGISGFIGSAIARHLNGAGHAVTGLLRPSSRSDHVEAFADRLVVGDHADPRVWGEFLQGAGCVIHGSVDWGPLRGSGSLREHLRSNLEGSILLLEAARPRQFVFMSSVAVIHDVLPRWRGHIDEDHPPRPAGAYGAYKAAVEAHLWSAWLTHGQSTTALRPCGVYGVDPRIERSIGYPILRSVMAGEAFRRPGGGKFVHVDDVAAAAVAVVGNPQAAGRAYTLADCYARWADWALMAAEVAGVRVEVDASSPPQPRNQFSKDSARTLGVMLDRGHEGIRAHLRELSALMGAGARRP
jgi:nucleoside-diphosphate-sugar epimerase